MGIPKGKCKKCGAMYCGWILEDPQKRICAVCNGQIEIVDNRNDICGHDRLTELRRSGHIINEIFLGKISQVFTGSWNYTIG